ncbi:MAG: hypothetical protein WKF82_02700 [Nocardioidaceae bacterium]
MGTPVTVARATGDAKQTLSLGQLKKFAFSCVTRCQVDEDIGSRVRRHARSSRGGWTGTSRLPPAKDTGTRAAELSRSQSVLLSMDRNRVHSMMAEPGATPELAGFIDRGLPDSGAEQTCARRQTL